MEKLTFDEWYGELILALKTITDNNYCIAEDEDMKCKYHGRDCTIAMCLDFLTNNTISY